MLDRGVSARATLPEATRAARNNGSQGDRLRLTGRNVAVFCLALVLLVGGLGAAYVTFSAQARADSTASSPRVEVTVLGTDFSDGADFYLVGFVRDGVQTTARLPTAEVADALPRTADRFVGAHFGAFDEAEKGLTAVASVDRDQQGFLVEALQWIAIGTTVVGGFALASHRIFVISGRRSRLDRALDTVLGADR